LESFPDVPLSQFGFAEAVGWWQHSVTTFKTMLWAAGFDEVEEVSRFRLNCKAAIPLIKVVLKGYPKPRKQMGNGLVSATQPHERQS